MKKERKSIIIQTWRDSPKFGLTVTYAGVESEKGGIVREHYFSGKQTFL